MPHHGVALDRNANRILATVGITTSGARHKLSLAEIIRHIHADVSWRSSRLCEKLSFFSLYGNFRQAPLEAVLKENVHSIIDPR